MNTNLARAPYRTRYPLVALPRPAQKLVFRPARRVSWATRIFTVLVMILAVCTVAAFLAVVLPERIAALGANEAKELATARTSAETVHESVVRLWADLAPGSPNLPADQLSRDLAAAQAAEKATGDVLNHISAAQALLAEADGVPFQLHHPAFVK